MRYVHDGKPEEVKKTERYHVRYRKLYLAEILDVEPLINHNNVRLVFIERDTNRRCYFKSAGKTKEDKRYFKQYLKAS